MQHMHLPHDLSRQAPRTQQQVGPPVPRDLRLCTRCTERTDSFYSEAKVLARIQKAVSRSPAAAAAAADIRVPLPTKFKIPTAAPTAKDQCFDLWDRPIHSFADPSKPENHSRLPRGITSGTISQAAAPLKSSHNAARIPHPGASYRPSVQDHQVPPVQPCSQRFVAF